MEPHPPRHRAGPHPHAALRASPDFGVWSFYDLGIVTRGASPADVPVTDDDAGSREDAAEDLLHRRVLGAALPIRARKNEVAR
ncbi:MAG: hypothetical protein AUG04_05610 [Deltaproteobacteria bacterium 13_1_20CM_2_69_21]|nr:MAG: hypothetical protein AUG04_05610 [Deltaproteobacteria bacterium 13_1_20CM_2_69_21]